MDAEGFVLRSSHWLAQGMWYQMVCTNPSFMALSTVRRLAEPQLSSQVDALRMWSGACMLLIDTVVAADTWVSSLKHMGRV